MRILISLSFFSFPFMIFVSSPPDPQMIMSVLEERCLVRRNGLSNPNVLYLLAHSKINECRALIRNSFPHGLSGFGTDPRPFQPPVDPLVCVCVYFRKLKIPVVHPLLHRFPVGFRLFFRHREWLLPHRDGPLLQGGGSEWANF